MSMKTFKVIASVLLMLVFVTGSWASAFAQDGTDDEQQGTTAVAGEQSFVRGNQGIFVPAGADPDFVNVELVGKRTTGGGVVYWARDPLLVEFTGDGFQPFTYVFFELWPWQVRAYENGNLQVFGENADGTWSACSSFLVGGPAEVDRGTIQRVGCVVTGSGVYGIGSMDKSDRPLIAP